MFSNQLVVLTIDDDSLTCKLLKNIFKAQGYLCRAVSTGLEGVTQTLSSHPDIVILELDLPDMDGKEVIRKIRKYSSVPIIVLSSRDQEKEKIAVLDAGADNFAPKPFHPEVFLARTRAILSRSMFAGKSLVSCQDLIIDLVRCHVTINKINVRLTQVEYKIIKALAEQQGKVLTYSQLFDAVKGKTQKNQKKSIHYIQQFIAQVRQKIENDPVHPRYIITERSFGYRLANQETSVKNN